MKKFSFTRIFSFLLALLLVLEMLPMHTFAASISYYQTSKADVPIWSTASSKSTKIRTVSAKGTVLKVTGSTTNSSGNLWYQLSDGYWVFSGNVTKHSHSYSGGICTGNSCGYEWPYSVASASGTFVVTNTSGAKLWTRPYSHNSYNVSLAGYGSAHTVVGKTTNQEGNLWYKLSSGYWVFSGNVTQQFTVSYNANGGSGAPAAQTVLSGNNLKLSSTAPTRSGYVFQGWATSSGSSSVSYKSGSSYQFSSSVTLYAVWKACSHSYKGGYCSSCGHEYALNISTYASTRTFIVTNKDGAKIWDRPYSNNSTHKWTASYNTALSITAKTTNADDNLWYRLSDGTWVFSGNVTQQFTVSYNANGGSGAPGAQTFLSGKTLTLSSKKPSRAGYIFKGWATSSSATKAEYKAGASYSDKKSITLYAVWEACPHTKYSGGYCETCGREYPLSISAYSSALTFVVTNQDGAKIWSRPYSKKSTHLRTETNKTALTITAKVKNADGNTWYQLSDGSWVYSGNVTRQYTVKYNANGGSGAPGAQAFLSGKTLTLSSKKPSRAGYIFKGWATSSSATKAEYKAGASYSAKKSITLYAVWESCPHDKFTGGYCNTCDKEYNLKVTTYSSNRTFIVTNDEGANIWSRPYSKKSTTVRVAKYKTALTVTAKAVNADGNTWYQLSDGNWVYSGNVTQQFTVKYSANGGSGAPGAQTFLSGKTLKLSTTKPKWEGYLFKGWATSKSATKATYKSGASYSDKKSITLYAVWEKCKHEDYTGGYCDDCGKEYKLDITTYSSPLTFVATKDGSVTIWSRPYSKASAKLRKAKEGTVLTITAKVKNADGNTWYQLSDGGWVYSKNITRQYKVTYDANGGKKVPSAQTFLKGKKLTLTTKEPVRDEHVFQGWATSPDSKTVDYAPGATYAANKDLTLYAVWTQCTHEYKYGICKHCNHEWPHTLVDITNKVYKVNDSDGATSYKRPYSQKKEKSATYKKGDVVLVTHEAVNENGTKWYKLKDGSWIKASEVDKQITYSKLTSVTPEFYTHLQRGNISAKKISGVWYYVFTYKSNPLYLNASAFTDTENNSSLENVSKNLTTVLNAHTTWKEPIAFVYNKKDVSTDNLNGVNQTKGTYKIHTWTLNKLAANAGPGTGDEFFVKCQNDGCIRFIYHTYVSQNVIDNSPFLTESARPGLYDAYKKPSTADEYVACLERSTVSAKVYPQFKISVVQSNVDRSGQNDYFYTGYFTQYSMSGMGYAKKTMNLGDYIELFSSVDKFIKPALDVAVSPLTGIPKALFDSLSAAWDLGTTAASYTNSASYSMDEPQSVTFMDPDTGECYRPLAITVKSPIRLKSVGDYIRADIKMYMYSGQTFKVELQIK